MQGEPVIAFALCLSALLLCQSFLTSALPRSSSSRSRRSARAALSAATQPQVVDVDLGDRSYPIYIGSGMLQEGDLIRKHISSKKALIVTNTKVGPLYSAQVRRALERDGKVEVFEVVLPDGEEFKTMDVLMKIIDAAMEAKLDRKSTMIALGGGVVGDMTGFAAAIYLRGIRFVQIPTTLMAMVDSAVGGKTAVNHPLGKNMIGAFYQPEAVLCDTDSLKTLPDRELCSGIAEVVKYGLIRDSAFFDWQEKNMAKIVGRDDAALVETIKRSCENKAAVVAADEKEGSGGVRMTLNLGHTFGHAIETGLGYGAWLHGEAVGCGMVMAAQLSFELGLVEAAFVDRLRSLIVRAGLPVTGPVLDPQDNAGRYLELMQHDKKAEAGEIRFVVISGQSKASMQAAPQAMVRSVIDTCCA